MSGFVEMNYEEKLNVTGGAGLIGKIIGAVSTALGFIGFDVLGSYGRAEEKAYEEAYKEAYDKEMLRLNLENPIPWGDIIRESYEN